MHHVKLSWLRILQYSLFAPIGVLFAAYLLFGQLHVPDATKTVWGITPAILTIGVIYVIYYLVADRLLLRRSPWITTIISLAIFSFLLASIIESSGNTNVVYRAVYITLVFFMGMAGLYAPLTTIIFTWMLLIFTITGIATPTNASLTFNITVDTLLTISGLAGWLVFRRYYETNKEELELETKLETEQSKTSVILESITDGVMIISPEGTVQVLNQSCADMLGWDHQEATNLDYRSLFSVESDDGSDQTQADAITQAMTTSTAVQRVSLIKTHHDRHLYIDIVASPIITKLSTTPRPTSQNKSGIVAVLRNVDSAKRQEQQRSDFISTASHEMRTHVASIQGFIELALNPKVATIDDKAKSYLEKAYESTKHLGELFQDLLTVSKSEDGRLVNHPKLVDINESLTEVVEQNTVRAADKGLTLSFDQSATNGKTVRPLLYVNVDPERLHEIVSNLVENAIKYTPRGLVTIGASLKEQSIVLRVSDSGIGIATEDIPHLFQKFYRTDNSATREIGGTGLGLYITKQIVEMMGGKIWVESTLGSGSTFYVELPRVTPEQIGALKAQQEQADKA